MPRRLHLALAALLAAVGCDEADRSLGAPCEVDGHCPQPLVCDVHESRGSCQYGHEHELEIGAPCTSDEDCTEPMVCDLHGDDGGWCAPPHEHDTGAGETG